MVQFIGSKELGGAESFFARLNNSLGKTDLDVKALLPKSSKVASLLDSKPYEVSIFSVSDPISKFLVRHSLENIKPDIVQSWMGRATRLTPRKRAYIQVSRLGGYYNLEQYQHSDYWIGNTKGICDYLIISGFPASKVFHISNFVNPILFEKEEARHKLNTELGLEIETKVIFSLGRLHPNKGFDILLKAFAEFKKSRETDNVILLVAGVGELADSLQALADELGISESVKWLGWREDGAELMAASDLFICPSRHEPLGNVILEAWAQQIPVISTQTDGAKELSGERGGAVLTPIDDSVAMASAITEWYSSKPEAYERLAEVGFELLRAHYSESVIVKQYQDLYSDIAPK